MPTLAAEDPLRLRPDVGGNKKHNDYHIARVARRAFSYTGIKTFPLQDGAMTKDQCGHAAMFPLSRRGSLHTAYGSKQWGFPQLPRLRPHYGNE